MNSMFRKIRRRPHEPEKRPRISLFSRILMAVGFLTLVYLFITLVIMPILAALTPSVR